MSSPSDQSLESQLQRFSLSGPQKTAFEKAGDSEHQISPLRERCTITARNSAPIKDKIIRDLAFNVSTLDSTALLLVKRAFEDATERNVPITGLDRPASEELTIIDDALIQINNAITEKEQYSDQYLKDKKLLKYWHYAAPSAQAFLQNKEGDRRPVVSVLTSLEKAALPLFDLLLEALKEGALNEEEEATIRGRWRMLDVILGNLYIVTGDDGPRVSSWPEVAQKLRRAGKSARSAPEAVSPSTPNPVLPQTPLRLLALDGGGVRGLSSLIVLKHIMGRISQQRGRLVEPWEEFDMIGGTSTGG